MNHPPEPGAETDVVRFHTRGVRFPRLIGKTADGTRLPGGPYTITQVVATVTIFIVGQWTRPVWGGNGLAGDYLVLVTWYPANSREQANPKNRLPAKYAGPKAKTFADYRKLLDDLKPQAIVIAVPLHLHYQIASDCLAAGCDLFLEKTAIG